MDMLKEEQDVDILLHTESLLNEKDAIDLKNSELPVQAAFPVRKNEDKVNHFFTYFLVCMCNLYSSINIQVQSILFSFSEVNKQGVS